MAPVRQCSLGQSGSALAPRAAPRLLCSLLLLVSGAVLLPRHVRAWGDGGGGGGGGDDGWSYGRATHYGHGDGGDVDHGSCMYGSLPNSMVSTGLNIAALSDQASDFSESCGRCYEVQCHPTSFSDGYGQHIDRNYGCNQGTTITVTVTDSCPCDYPANAYSNRRWCCGDMYHMDLSYWAFTSLADAGLGVIGIRYRQVTCPGGAPAPRPQTWDFMAGTKK
ncbi:hypothetical protein HYH03_000277 [Edaphochlamys debaryana]|uniref:Expansin-like EG45 domain-containing protein n=1 Tax=Edaphochlamys debaryana TaxID=47281 RepID=A0A836C7H1_9CHLO|nr:hypothetical protein HYH03_000277 [Edaphochlamys debaryana]|eukprot:KAG2501777.1 hypothetical protein HYH03_000277 [Edaphochlamys debaryana]